MVTQRVIEVPTSFENPTTEVQSPCNPDEVVTGGGYDLPDSSFGLFVIEEFAVNNAWHIKVNFGNPGSVGATIKVFAECLKLVPS